MTKCLASKYSQCGETIPVGTHEGKIIYIGADHRGFPYKMQIAAWLERNGYDVMDVGTHSDERCDYPKISSKIGKAISSSKTHGIVGVGICGSGTGIIIPASKYERVYGARCMTPKDAEDTRRHNNTNLLGIGADCVDIETAKKIVEVWLTIPFWDDDPVKNAVYLERYEQTLKFENLARI